MLEQNPFLETEDEAEPAFERSLEPPPASASAGSERDEAEARSEAATSPPAMSRAAEFDAAEREEWDNGTDRDDFDGIRELPANSPAGGRGGR